MKKVTVIVLCLIILLSLTACKDNNAANANSENLSPVSGSESVEKVSSETEIIESIDSNKKEDTDSTTTESTTTSSKQQNSSQQQNVTSQQSSKPKPSTSKPQGSNSNVNSSSVQNTTNSEKVSASELGYHYYYKNVAFWENYMAFCFGNYSGALKKATSIKVVSVKINDILCESNNETDNIRGYFEWYNDDGVLEESFYENMLNNIEINDGKSVDEPLTLTFIKFDDKTIKKIDNNATETEDNYPAWQMELVLELKSKEGTFKDVVILEYIRTGYGGYV